MAKYVNCTPHAVNIIGEDQETVLTTIAPSGIIARCQQETVRDGENVDDETGIIIPESSSEFGEVYDLPEEKEGQLIIVSRLVLSAILETTNRKDLRVPNELVRDEKGNIIGCQSLAKK